MLELLELVLVVVLKEVCREEIKVLEDGLVLLVVHVVQGTPEIFLALKDPMEPEQLVDFVLLLYQLSLEDFYVVLVDNFFWLIVRVDGPLTATRRELFRIQPERR